MKKFSIIGGLAIMLLFSGCSLFGFGDDDEKSILYIEQEGTVQKATDSVFSFEYVLVDESQKVLSAIQSETENIADFLDTTVVIKGEEIEEDNTTPSYTKPVLLLNVVQIASIANYTPTIKKFIELGVSLPLTEDMQVEEKKEIGVVTKGKDEENFLKIFKQQDSLTAESFEKKGEKITLGKNTVLRRIDGKTRIFFPTKGITIEFLGEASDLPQFYEILENAEFFNPFLLPSDSSEKTENTSKTDKNFSVSDQKEIVKYLHTNLQNIIKEPQEVKISKIAFYKNDLLDIEYSQQETKKRVVLQYTKKDEEDDEEEYSYSPIAKYAKGEVQSWELISGEYPQLTGQSEIFLADIDNKTQITLPENFALYVSTHFDFQVGYPRKMYYSAQGKTEKNLAQVRFAYSPVEQENIVFLLEILDGKEEKKRESMQIKEIVIPRNEKTHFKISTPDESEWQNLQQMANTLQSHL